MFLYSSLIIDYWGLIISTLNVIELVFVWILSCFGEGWCCCMWIMLVCGGCVGLIGVIYCRHCFISVFCRADILIKRTCQPDPCLSSVSHTPANSGPQIYAKTARWPFTRRYRSPALPQITRFLLMRKQWRLQKRRTFRAERTRKEKSLRCIDLRARESPESSTPHNVRPFKAADLCSLSRAFSVVRNCLLS